MKRIIAALALAASFALAAPALAQAYQDCYPVYAHSGRPSPRAAYDLRVYDWYGSRVYKAYVNSEGWYFQRGYGGYMMTILWHESNWISNYSDYNVDACFFVATPDRAP